MFRYTFLENAVTNINFSILMYLYVNMLLTKLFQIDMKILSGKHGLLIT